MKPERVFFIADLHLDPENTPKLTGLFLSFLDYVRNNPGELFILGDFFDYWANNRWIFQKNLPVFQSLQRLIQYGCPVNILYGNRDFLLKAGYLRKFGIQFLGEQYRLRLGIHELLLTHGDIFSQDKGYKRYRWLGWNILYLLDLCAPGWLEHKVAMILRQRSRRKSAQRGENCPGLDEAILKPYFDRGCDTIICGHTHQPQIKNYPSGRQLIILPNWVEQGGYCVFERGTFSLRKFG